MKTRIFLLLATVITLFLCGCATPSSQHGNRKVNVLGGLIVTEQAAYDRSGPMTIGLKSSEVLPGAKFDGDKVTLLWGLLTFTDE